MVTGEEKRNIKEWMHEREEKEEQPCSGVEEGSRIKKQSEAN
jgi:hypothetical protein